MSDPTGKTSSLSEIALLFLRLGVIGFGGPAAHIALMEEEVVRRRRWMSREAFLDLLGATHLIPGPNSTEMAIHIGYARGGVAGLLLAGLAFIVPAAVMVLGFGWAYVRYGSLPPGEALLYGVKPVVMAVVVQALVGLGRAAMKTKLLGALVLAVGVVNFAWGHEILLLFAAGAVAALAHVARPGGWGTVVSLGSFFGLASAAGGGASTALPFGLGPLFWFFLKVGSVLFGSGYVLLAFLRADLVERWQWLTETELLDAIAIGQVTPGPVFTTATFIGYILGGLSGAIIATAGIFLPAFVFVALSGPLVPRIRRSPVAGAFLDGVVAASLALMAVVTVRLAHAAVVDLSTAVIALVTAVLLVRYRLSSAWLIAAAGLLGLLVH